jgi:hypothetical protein
MEHIAEVRITYKVLAGKLKGKGTLGRYLHNRQW